ncbi:hypothetical protein K4A83_14550 [Spirulina subsalsa FACHB-351]|uniref:HicB n=1 Tax=Spirulina subsalsa FACHB-351 TaxID=234711 RepID=A0ABT3L7L0_9CYAN|nr:hypothetical protein [Spirulina subsalsa]MCW6037484.1 hypothetical protein [Spirulina subsalsa FACHB-351]
MTIENSKHYCFRISWSDEDQEYVGLCAEFPSLSYLDEDSIQALVGIQELVDDVIADLQANGEPIPEPISQSKVSRGRPLYP